MVHLFSLQCLSSLWFSYTCLVFSNALLPPQLCDYRVPTISFPLKGWFLGEEKGRNRTPRLGSVNPCGVFPLLFISDLPQTIPPRLDGLALLFSTFQAAAQDRSPSCVLAECCAAPQLILQPHTILAPGVKTCRHTGSIVTTNVLLSKHNWCFSMVLTQISSFFCCSHSAGASVPIAHPWEASVSYRKQIVKRKEAEMWSHRLFPSCAGVW